MMLKLNYSTPAVRRARTNFNPLELLAELPKEAQTVLDAVSAGRRERADSSAAARGGGAISEAVASALVAHPAGIDSSTHEGAWITVCAFNSIATDLCQTKLCNRHNAFL
jgi:hypothetical protein